MSSSSDKILFPFCSVFFKWKPNWKSLIPPKESGIGFIAVTKVFGKGSYLSSEHAARIGYSDAAPKGMIWWQ